MENVKRLLTKEEASCILKISTRTLDRRIKAGILKPIRVGRYIRFQVDAINGINQKEVQHA